MPLEMWEYINGQLEALMLGNMKLNKYIQKQQLEKKNTQKQTTITEHGKVTKHIDKGIQNENSVLCTRHKHRQARHSQ